MNKREYMPKLLEYLGCSNDAKAVRDSGISLYDLFETQDQALILTQGISEKAIEIMNLTAALNSRRITDKFKIGKNYLQNELIDYLIALFYGVKIERIYALGLSDDGKLLCVEPLGDGTVNTSAVLPRRITECLSKVGATKVILAHNHPLGRAENSTHDIAFTAEIRSVLINAGIELLHHYVVAGFEISDCLDGTIN